MSRRIFGSGLSNILDVVKLSTDDMVSHSGIHKEFKIVSLHEIKPSKYQPRRNFDSKSLEELAASIREQGVLQPLTVRKTDSEEYELIAGERRWRAAQIAGLQQLPVIICEVDDNQLLAYSIIENIQRQDLDPIEEAMSLQRLLEEFSMTHEEVAKAIGRSRTMVTNMLRLLNLTEHVKNMLASRKLDMGHARALLSLPEEKQAIVAQVIFDKNMSVRSTENYIKSLQTFSRKQNKRSLRDEKILMWEKQLLAKLGVRIKILADPEGESRIIFYFAEGKKLESIINKLLSIM